MSHSNGHSRNPGLKGHSSPFLFRNIPEEESEEESNERTESAPQGSGQEADVPDTLTGLPEEWNRVSALALKHLKRCVLLEPKVLQGNDANAIHDLRVATRRLQQVIDLLFPKPHSGEIRKLYRGLKRCRESLSEIRNDDVLLERIGAALARKRTARREAWEAIEEYLKEKRSARIEKALRKLAKANLSAIYVRLKEYMPSDRNSGGLIPDGNGAASAFTREQFYKRISESLQTVWTTFEQEIARSRHQRDATVLHSTRIAAKRVRYLIEVIHAFNVAGSREALVWLRSLQTQLGDWHDLLVFEQVVIGMIADPDFLRDHLEKAIQIERLILRNRALKSKLEKRYFEMTCDRTGLLKTRGWVRRMGDSPAAQFAGS